MGTECCTCAGEMQGIFGEHVGRWLRKGGGEEECGVAYLQPLDIARLERNVL